MASKKNKTKGNKGKVGSDEQAAKHFDDNPNDFGLPPRNTRQDIESHQDVGPVPEGDRSSGVGRPQGRPGQSSGGDLDTTYTGITGGLAQSPPDRITTGPASSEHKSNDFASGRPAKGENQEKPGTIGGGGPVGDVHARDADRTATGQEQEIPIRPLPPRAGPLNQPAPDSAAPVPEEDEGDRA